MCKVLLYHLELRKTFLFFIGFRASSFAFLIHAWLRKWVFIHKLWDNELHFFRLCRLPLVRFSYTWIHWMISWFDCKSWTLNLLLAVTMSHFLNLQGKIFNFVISMVIIFYLFVVYCRTSCSHFELWFSGNNHRTFLRWNQRRSTRWVCTDWFIRTDSTWVFCAWFAILKTLI